MAIIRKKDIQRLNKQELKERLKDLEMELLKSESQKGQAAAGTKRSKEIKRTMARINFQLSHVKE